MASDRPDYLPEWATNSFALPVSGQQNKVRPPAGWRTDGWDENEEPAVNYENWQMNRVYDWLRYMDNNAVRVATAFVCASDATDAMIDMATSADSAVNKWLCDGTADNVQIQAAIDAVNAAGGGLVLLSEGTFVIDTPMATKTGVVLAGMGKGSTIIQLEAGMGVSLTSILEATTQSNIGIQDLTIDGNKAAQAGAFQFPGIVFDAVTNAVIRDVIVKNLYDDAESEASIEIKGGASSGCVIERCGIFDCESLWNVEITGGSGHVVTENRIVRDVTTNIDSILCGASSCKVENNLLIGGGINVGAGGTGAIVIGNRFTGVAGNDSVGITISGTSRVSLIGNSISAGEVEGIWVNVGSHIEVASNFIWGCSQKVHNNFDGILIGGASTDCSVTNNVVRHGGGGAQHQFGIQVAAAAANIWTCGNDFGASGATASISDAGNKTLFPLNSGIGPYQVWDPAAGPAAHVAATVTMFNRV